MSIGAVTLVNGQFVPKQGTLLNGNGVKTVAKLRQGSPDGVSPDYIPYHIEAQKPSNVPPPIAENTAVMTTASCESQWFLMRAAYGQEQKAQEYLTGRDGIDEVFCPQWPRDRRYGGKIKRVMVSLLPNMLFVKSTREVLSRYVGTPPLSFFHHYYEPHKDEQGREVGSGRRPLIIPDGQMRSFRQWYEADEKDKIYMNGEFHFKNGDLVRVTEGSFAGFEGHVVRLKGQTRVGVNINGVGFISTTYIPKYCLEKL